LRIKQSTQTKYANLLSHFLSGVLLIFFVELYYDRGNHHEFVSLVKDLARPGEMAGVRTWATVGGRWKFGYLLPAL